MKINLSVRNRVNLWPLALQWHFIYRNTVLEKLFIEGKAAFLVSLLIKKI